MKERRVLSRLALILSVPLAASLKLNVTAIGARDGLSTLECWQTDKPFNTSSQPGTAGTAIATLSNVSNLSYTIIPSDFDGGVHNAPYAQWVVFTSGLAYITLPGGDGTSAIVSGGQFGLIFAADTADVSRKGHRTQYPGITETIALQIPTQDGKVPEHSVLHMGPCAVNEVAGIREFGTAGTSLDQVNPKVEGWAYNLLPFHFR
ncbi:hypothetical protein GGS26DRAFT_591058 [Hypomontagnella submonticulosa]|nr:hypothetical protein GGS26DRAFT_591058 [Hypomontagnella submonticulosa]